MSGSAWQIISEVESGLKDGYVEPLEAAQRLSKVIHETAVNVLGVVGPKQHRLPSGRTPNKWFQHCKQEYGALKEAIRRGDTHAAKQLKQEFRKVQRKWERYFDRKHQERMVDELKHNPRKFWSAFNNRRAYMLQFDIQQLHTYGTCCMGDLAKGH